jgi:hypothetical protein
VCVVEESVDGGACQERVAEEGAELAGVAVGGEDERSLLVAETDDLVEVVRLVGGEGARSSRTRRSVEVKRAIRRS